MAFMTNAQKHEDSLRGPLSLPCRDCGADLAVEDHRRGCEPYFDEDALFEQAVHERHVRGEDLMGVPDWAR